MTPYQTIRSDYYKPGMGEVSIVVTPTSITVSTTGSPAKTISRESVTKVKEWTGSSGGAIAVRAGSRRDVVIVWNDAPHYNEIREAIAQWRSIETRSQLSTSIISVLAGLVFAYAAMFSTTVWLVALCAAVACVFGLALALRAWLSRQLTLRDKVLAFTPLVAAAVIAFRAAVLWWNDGG